MLDYDDEFKKHFKVQFGLVEADFTDDPAKISMKKMSDGVITCSNSFYKKPSS